MIRNFSAKNFPFSLLPVALLVIACSQDSSQTAAPEANGLKLFKPVSEAQSQAPDVIARVGSETITFSEINTMLNSSAVVGLSIPALGTPQRDVVRVTLLDKMVSANLIYLDALEKGLDRDPEYQQAMRRFSNGILADLYFRGNLAGDVEVSEEEIQAVYDETIVADTELTDELRGVIEATVRKRKLEEQQSTVGGQLRAGVDVTIYQNNISPEGDADRAGDTVVAEADGETITWNEVRHKLTAAGKGAVLRDELAMEIEARIRALQAEVDTRLLAKKARAAGLETDARYTLRLNEYRKTRLINLHRARLAAAMEPTDDQLEAYFEANRGQISRPEFRKVQMVMLDDEAQAKALAERIRAGEITMFQAASEHSVAPDAKQNLGEIGWIAEGKLKPELDAEVFSLGPGEIGGPVQAGGLWHLVMVLDIRDEENTNLADERTRMNTRRRYIHEKLNDYVVALRRDKFKVEVDEDMMVRLAQRESDMVKQLATQAQDPASVTRQRIEEMQEIMRTP